MSLWIWTGFGCALPGSYWYCFKHGVLECSLILLHTFVSTLKLKQSFLTEHLVTKLSEHLKALLNSDLPNALFTKYMNLCQL